MRRHLIPKSKFLSLILRHNPGVVGLALDSEGWVDVDALLKAVQSKHPDFDREMLEEIVATSEKIRFAYSEDKTRIRASQGHSIGINLGLSPSTPPKQLFHGTASRNLRSIRKGGLVRGNRDFVHLSLDTETARKVGMRHGSPCVLRIKSGEMHKQGVVFYVSDNGVWLTREVNPQYIIFDTVE